MMNEIPQIKDSQPILNAQNVSSTAKGTDAFAEALGNLAGQASKEAEKIEDNQSQSMYINSVSNVEQLKTKAQMQMLEHPDQAGKVAQNMKAASDVINQAAYVNDQDRVKLKAYISSANDDVDLAATRTSVHQTQLMSAYTHYANWPSQLKAYQDALMKDPDKAENLKTSIISNLKNLVSIGALTPHEAGSSIKTMSDIVDVQQQWLSAFQNGDVNAKDYHTMTSSVLPRSPQEIANSPMDENTGWMVNSHASDRSFQGVLSDLYKHNYPDFQTFNKLQPAQRDHVMLTYQGVKEADGYINSGSPLPEIQRVYDDLNQRGRVLSYKEQGTRNALGQFLHRVKGGDFLSAIQGTPGGASILQNYTNNNMAIQNSPMSDEQKSKATLDNLNNMVSGAVSYGYGAHFAPNLIQPIPKPIVDMAQSAFKAGNDPTILLQAVGQFRDENKPWLAQAMPKASQKVVVNTIALAGNFSKPSDMIDYVAANQEGRSFLKVSEGQEKGAISDSKLQGLIASQPVFQNAMSVVRVQYDPLQTQEIQSQIVKTAANYVKYQAEKNGDFTLANKDEYIQKAMGLIGNAYPKISSTNYIANPRQLNLTPPEMDILSHYALDQAYTYLKEGVKESVYMSAVDRNNLKVTVSPTNEILAVDGNNKVYWHAPFSANLMGAARRFWAQQEEDSKKLQKEYETMRYGAGGLL